MNYLNGGYVMIKHNAAQKDLAAAYKSNRPVLVYDENQKAHWAQINETVTTETVDDEVVTTYTYSYQLINAIESVVDSAGNLRFIEGDGEPLELTGFISSYCKWSLSGTHLMLVLAGTVDNTTTLANNSILAKFALPQYILDKIFIVWGNKYIAYVSASAYAINGTSQVINYFVTKETDSIQFVKQADLTLTNDRSFRIQFDLLIDADYSE